MVETIYSKLQDVSKLILNFLLFNFIWLILNSPLLIVLMQLYLTESIESYFILVPIALVLLPILFFPSTQALFATMRESVVKDDWLSIGLFFSIYKASFKNSLFMGVSYTGVTIIMGYLLFLAWDMSTILFTIIGFTSLYLTIITFHFFLMEAHFSMPLLWKIKNAFSFVFAHPFVAFFNFILFVSIQYIIWNVTIIMYIILGMTLTSYLSVYVFILKVNKLKKKATPHYPI